MSAIKKIVKIAKKKGYKAIWHDSEVKFDIHIIKGSEKYDTYVITLNELDGKIKPNKLDANYLYKSVTSKLLLKLHQKNLVVLFDQEGKALAVKKIKNINIGVYQKRELNKFLTTKEPAFSNLYKEVTLKNNT